MAPDRQTDTQDQLLDSPLVQDQRWITRDGWRLRYTKKEETIQSWQLTILSGPLWKYSFYKGHYYQFTVSWQVHTVCRGSFWKDQFAEAPWRHTRVHKYYLVVQWRCHLLILLLIAWALYYLAVYLRMVASVEAFKSSMCMLSFLSSSCVLWFCSARNWAVAMSAESTSWNNKRRRCSQVWLLQYSH